MLDNLVDKAQSAFVPGRLILDNILTAKELIHSMNQYTSSVLGDFALKIDISKAYDRVSRIFLGQCLRAYGITSDTYKLIMNCVATASLSIIVRNSEKTFYKWERSETGMPSLTLPVYFICSGTLMDDSHNGSQ
ncbi:uncharacterized protein LOC113272114 [Papaver somniferum]|uniref:uncharacterized protein LOC113272114 n=1 Tax=Papaver somniferum TaxID=3469 RepID=UPI000E6F5382|nr:uncharacterized protein LOC113272114 [Papaver somniferum]